MPYEFNHTKTYNHPADRTIKSAATIIEALGGKASKKSDPSKGWLEANFNKKVKGDFINNRCQLEVKIEPVSPEQCSVSAQAYPVDPIGRKLMFGVRGKPAQHVVNAFFAELDTQLE